MWFKLVYEPFSKTNTGLFYPAIEHSRAGNNDNKDPTPQSTVLYQRAPTLVSDIGIDGIGKERHQLEMPHVQTERNRCNPT
jgi:hypothetical protein